MNPYVYSRGRKGHQGRKQQSASLLKEILSAQLGTAMAFAMVLFAAGSAASLTAIAYSEISNSDFSSPAPLARAAVPAPRVLGETTSTPRVGQLILINSTVFVVDETGLYGVPNIEVFNSWGWNFSQVQKPNSAEAALSQIWIVPMRNPACDTPISQIKATCNTSSAPRVGQAVLLNSQATVFLVGTTGLYGFADLPTFNSWGFTFAQVSKANAAEAQLPVAGTVPYRNPACASPLDQIAGNCGIATTPPPGGSSNTGSDIFVISDDGTLIQSGSNVDVEAVSRKFYSLHPGKNNYDFLSIFTTFDDPSKPHLHYMVRSDVAGVGPERSNLSSAFGSSKLLGVNFLDTTFTSDPLNSTEQAIKTNLDILNHETSHQWLTYIGGDFGFEAADGAHYGRWANTGFIKNGQQWTDTNGGWMWQDNKDGTLSIVNTNYRGLSNLSLYLMGLIPPTDVPDLQVVVPKDPSDNTSTTIAGSFKNVSVSDIIAKYGNRLPSYQNSQKDFKMAYILLTKQGETPAKFQTDAINFVANNFPIEWNSVTNGKSTINSGQDSAAPVPPSKTAIGFYKGLNQVSSAMCGETITLRVSGYSGSEVWLTQYKNHLALVYDQIDTVPDIYTLVCNKEEGEYINYAYSVVNGKKGTLLGITTFTVTGAASSALALGPVSLSDSGLYKGQAYRIKWDSKGVDKIYIKLRKNSAGDTVRAVSDAVNNNGYFDWTVPADLEDGYDYVIRVLSASGQQYADSSTFGIKSGSTNPPVTGTPAFYVGSAKATSANCGTAFTFKVDGYSPSQVWLVQYKNHSTTPNYNNIYTIPSAYTSSCATDPGPYTNYVYSVINGQKGEYIGMTQFTITHTVSVVPAPAYLFSHDGGNLVAGQTAWTYTLKDAKVGDTLSVEAYKDDIYVGKFTLCAIPGNMLIIPTTCASSGTPQLADAGSWREVVYINNVYKGVVAFTVSAPPSTNTTPPVSGTPAFYVGSAKATSANCGTAATFKVDGYSGSQVWLTQYKNHSTAPNYSNVHTVPSTYTFACGQDEGYYNNYVYSYVNGQKGSLLGTAAFTVNNVIEVEPVTNPISAPAPSVGFYKDGVLTTQITCGDTATFQVNNFTGSQIWLRQYKNGYLQYNGLYPTSDTYTYRCSNSASSGDEGSYQLYIYKVVNGAADTTLLASTAAVVLPK